MSPVVKGHPAMSESSLPDRKFKSFRSWLGPEYLKPPVFSWGSRSDGFSFSFSIYLSI